MQVRISYLEIYNDTVYDLLDPDREVSDVDDLPRVMVRETEDGQIDLCNLRICCVSSEEEALGLVNRPIECWQQDLLCIQNRCVLMLNVVLQLFLGDTNRTISETPMNMASSRSHCIFTMYIEARKVIQKPYLLRPSNATQFQADDAG